MAFPLANQIFTCTTILEDGSVYISSTCGSSYQPDANITITRATKTNEEIVIDNAVKFIGYEDQIRYDTDYEKTIQWVEMKRSMPITDVFSKTMEMVIITFTRLNDWIDK